MVYPLKESLKDKERAFVEKDKSLTEVHTSLTNSETSREALASKVKEFEETLYKER